MSLVLFLVFRGFDIHAKLLATTKDYDAAICVTTIFRNSKIIEPIKPILPGASAGGA
jgi:hypothetical protein